jgi:tRNA (guanine-N7-)-methyltransferase
MHIINEWGTETIRKFEKESFQKARLEIGSGNGLFLSEIAQMNPDVVFFGVERLQKCINKSKKKIEKKNLLNVNLIHGDIFTCLEKLFEKNIFEEIYINFPDPWFKKKHLKKRVVQDKMVKVYHDFLKEKGKIYFITDNENYNESGISAIINNGFFPLLPAPYFSSELENYPVSLYEEKWKKEGRNIYYSIFEKK